MKLCMKEWSPITQGVRSRRNVCESLRSMKNHVQIYVPKRPRTYEKHLLNLLISSIPDISTSTLKLLKSCDKLCNGIYSKLDYKISQFLTIDPFPHYLVFSHKHFLPEMLPSSLRTAL